ncbi:MAG: hypothetical protein V9H26_23820 [Verrucomicrobiota bacterium]
MSGSNKYEENPQTQGIACYIEALTFAHFMKSKLLVSLVVIMALVIGFFLGRWQVTHTLDHYIATLSMPEARRAMADFI